MRWCLAEAHPGCPLPDSRQRSAVPQRAAGLPHLRPGAVGARCGAGAKRSVVAVERPLVVLCGQRAHGGEGVGDAFQPRDGTHGPELRARRSCRSVLPTLDALFPDDPSGRRHHMALRTKSARRTSDRVEDLAAWVLVAAGLLVVLFSYGFGTQFYDQGLERARVESAERSPASARLLSDAQVTSSTDSRSSTVMVPVTWQDRFGSTHDGIVMVPRGLRAGGKVTLWTDGSGARGVCSVHEAGRAAVRAHRGRRGARRRDRPPVRPLGAGATRHDGRQLRPLGSRMARSRSELDPRHP